jgi:hypothetical protein
MNLTKASRMRIIENHFSRKHAFVFLAMLIVFTVLNFFAANAGIDDGGEHTQQVIMTTLATGLGPMTGAIARDFQGCCVRFSFLVLLYFSGPGLLIGALLQVVKLPFTKGQAFVRMFFWVIGLLMWFLGGFISYGHALV